MTRGRTIVIGAGTNGLMTTALMARGGREGPVPGICASGSPPGGGTTGAPGEIVSRILFESVQR